MSPQPTKYDLKPYAFGGQSPGERIRAFREAKEWAQADLAASVGMDRKAGQAVVSSWEKGIRMPSLEMLCLVCEVLDITPNDLLGFSKRGKKSAKAQISASKPAKVKSSKG